MRLKHAPVECRRATAAIRPPGDARAASWLAPMLVAATAASFVAPAFGQDRAEIDRTRIIGNRELPKVLYIVPWKKPLPGELSGRPVTSVLDEALAPIDRDVFRRQVQYDGQVKAPVAAAAPAPAPK